MTDFQRLTDLYHLDRYKDIISGMEGFGEKSCENILNAVEQSRKTIMAKVIYSLGIPGIGLSNAKMIVKAIGSDKEQLTTADRPALEAVKGVGAVMHLFPILKMRITGHYLKSY